MDTSPEFPTVLIPAYQPDEHCLKLVSALSALNINCIVVDDGSGADKQSIFERLQSLSHVIVLHHPTNQGKGSALKTGLHYYLAHATKNSPGIVTADADGQHTVEDIIAVGTQLCQRSESLILGVRHFDKTNIPLRSRFGNVLTKRLFSLVIGTKLLDTQTGLRGIRQTLIPEILQLHSNRYDFELEMLIFICKKHYPIYQQPIQTIYEENNTSSHFRVVVDSMKIYFVFFRFMLISLVSFAVDYTFFVIFYYMTAKLVPSLFLARLISATCNFMLNKQMTFKSSVRWQRSIIKYVVLSVCVFLASAYLTTAFVYLGINVYFAKILADTLIFIGNFSAQRLIVFPRGASE